MRLLPSLGPAPLLHFRHEPQPRAMVGGLQKLGAKPQKGEGPHSRQRLQNVCVTVRPEARCCDALVVPGLAQAHAPASI